VRLARNVSGISRLMLILLLIIFFLLGATFSYIWTMGFYAPGEFNLPSRTNAVIESVYFPPENATFFNVTVLNPSYSPSDAAIKEIKTATVDGKVHIATSSSPSLPFPLAPGKSATIKSLWNWGNYTGQIVDVYVVVAEGSGPVMQTKLSFMNFSVTSVNFNPSISVNHFNITVQNTNSSVPVDVTGILVNGVKVPTVPSLVSPYQLTNASSAPPASFMLMKNWTDLQGKSVRIQVQTLQGFSAYRERTAPSPMILEITEVNFNVNSTDRFRLTVQNSPTSPRYSVDINQTKLSVDSQAILVNTTSPSLPQTLPWNSSVNLTVFWNWASFEGKNMTITVLTRQGFIIRETAPIIPDPKVSFMNWTNLGVRVNTFDFSVNLAPSTKITAANATYGIWNWDIVAHTVSLHIFNITNTNVTNPAYIQNVTINVKLGTQTIATIIWNISDSLPTSWVTFTATASTKYTISIEVATTSGAVSGQTSVVAMEIKTDNP